MWFNLKFHPFSAGGMPKFQPVCTQGRKGVVHIFHTAPGFSRAILPIPSQGRSPARHLHPDLMVAPCLQADFYQLPALPSAPEPGNAEPPFSLPAGRRGTISERFSFPFLHRKSTHSVQLSTFFSTFSGGFPHRFCLFVNIHISVIHNMADRQVSFFHFSLRRLTA